MSTILTTGATGFIGRYIYRDLTKAGHEVWALVRGENPEKRLEEALSTITDHEIPVNVISGNIYEEDCGIKDISQLPSFDIIFHGAGMPIFDESKKDEVIMTNILGTSNIINLANKLKVNKIVNLSTAYSCGKTQGPIHEEQAVYHEWNNTYEMTKYTGENLLYSWKEKDLARRLINYRIPIVTGAYNDTENNYASSSTYLEFMSALYFFGTAGSLNIEIFGDPELPIYIEPVDIVSIAVTDILGFENAWNKTYHVICSNQKSVGWWIQTGIRYLNISGKVIITTEPTESSTVGRMVRRAIKQFNPYITSHPKLVTDNISSILPSIISNRIDDEYIARLMSYSVKNLYRNQK